MLVRFWPLVLVLLVAMPALASPPAEDGRANMRTAQAGPWSAPATWEGGVVPGLADRATVRHAVTLSGTVGVGRLVVAANGSLMNTLGETATLQVVDPSPAIIPTAGGSAQVWLQSGANSRGKVATHTNGGTLRVEVWGAIWNEGTWAPSRTTLRATSGQYLTIPGLDDPAHPTGWTPGGGTLGGLVVVEHASNVLEAHTPVAFEHLELNGARLQIEGAARVLHIAGSLDGGAGGGVVTGAGRVMLPTNATVRRVQMGGQASVRFFGDGILADGVSFMFGAVAEQTLTLVDAAPADLDVAAGAEVRHRRTLTGGPVDFYRTSLDGGSGQHWVAYRRAPVAGFANALPVAWTLTPEVGSATLASLALDYAGVPLGSMPEDAMRVWWRPFDGEPWQALPEANLTRDPAGNRLTVANAPNFGAFAISDYGPEYANARFTTGPGAWSNASIWTGGVPGADHVAVVRPGHTIALDNDYTVAGLMVEPGGRIEPACCSGRTLTVAGDLSNEGTLTSNGYQLWLRVAGDVHNAGTWAPHRTTLIGSLAQALSQADGTVFQGEWHNDVTARPITAGSDLAFDWTWELRGGRLDMDGHRLSLSGSTHFTGYLDGTTTFATVVTADTLAFSGNRSLWHVRLEGLPTLAGTVLLGDNVASVSPLVVGGRVEPVCCAGRTLRFDDRVENYGTLTSNGYQLILHAAGDITNAGTWAPTQTRLVGTSLQTLSQAAGTSFGGHVWADVRETPLTAASDLHFTGRVDLRATTLTMGARRLTLTGGDYTSGHLNGDHPVARLVFAEGGVLAHAPSRSFWHTRIEGPVSVEGEMPIGDGVRFTGAATLALASVVEPTCCSARTVAFEADVVNYGILRQNGYALHVDLAAGLINYNLWRPTDTRFVGTATQSIIQADSTVFEGNFYSMTPAGVRTLVAGSDLRFSGRVETRGSRFEMNAFRLALSGGDYFSGWDVATSTRGVLAFMEGGTFSSTPSRAFWDTRVEGPVRLEDRHLIGNGVTFAGTTTVASGAIVEPTCCSGRALTFEGAVVNEGTVAANGYTLHVQAHGDLTSAGTWTPTWTDLRAASSQALALSADAVFGSHVTQYAPTVTAASDLHFTGRYDVNGHRFEVGAYRLRATGNSTLSGWSGNVDPDTYGVLDFAGGTLELGGSRELERMRVEGTYDIAGTHELGHGVILDGAATVAEGARLEPRCCSGRTLVVRGTLDNRGTVTANGYTLRVEAFGDLTSAGTWTPTWTDLRAAQSQALALGADAVFGSHVTQYAPVVTAASDLHFTGRVDLAGRHLAMGAFHLALSGGDYLSGWDGPTSSRGTISFADGGAFDGTVTRSLWDVRVAGPALVGGTHLLGNGVIFEGATLAPSGRIEPTCCSGRTVTLNRGFVNHGTVTSNGYPLYVRADEGLANHGTWTVTETRLTAGPVPRVFAGAGIGGPIVSNEGPVFIAGTSVLPRLHLSAGADVRVLSGHSLAIAENGGAPVVGAGATYTPGASPSVTRAMTASEADHVFVRAVVRASSAGGLTGLTVSTATGARVPGFYNAERVAWTLVPTGTATPAARIVLHAPAAGAPARTGATPADGADIAAALGPDADRGGASTDATPPGHLTSALSAWHSADGGETWTELDGTHDALARTVTLTNAPTSGMLALAAAPPDRPLVVVAPAGGETWRHGETRVIMWSAASFVSTVEIVLIGPSSAASPADEARLLADVPAQWGGEVVLATVPASPTSWAWTIPASLPTGAGYRIAVRSATDGEVGGRSAAFTIRPVLVPYAVSAPGAGTTVRPGELARVHWAGAGVPGAAADSAVVSLRQGAGRFREIARVANTGRGGVRLPADTPPGPDYQMRVARASEPEDTFGESARFTVSGHRPSLPLARAAQTLARGATADVTWDAAAAGCANVELVLTDRRGREHTLAAPNTGRLAWAVPPDARAGRHVVELRCDGEAVADAPSVVVAALAPLAPAAGARWTAGERQTVAWAGPTLDPDGTVRLELRRPGASAVVLAEGLRYGDGEAPVVVPDVASGDGWHVVVAYRHGARTLTVAGAPISVSGAMPPAGGAAPDGPPNGGPWTVLDVTGVADAAEITVYMDDVRLASAAVEGGAATVWVPSAIYGVAVAEGAPLALRVRRADGAEAPLAIASVTSGRDGEMLLAPEASPGDVLAVTAVADEVPSAFELSSPWPNPAPGTSAVVRLALPEPSVVWLRVYDARGRLVATPLDGASLAAGWHEARVGVSALAAGVYVLRLQAGASTATQRLTVVR